MDLEETELLERAIDQFQDGLKTGLELTIEDPNVSTIEDLLDLHSIYTHQMSVLGQIREKINVNGA